VLLLLPLLEEEEQRLREDVENDKHDTKAEDSSEAAGGLTAEKACTVELQAVRQRTAEESAAAWLRAKPRARAAEGCKRSSRGSHLVAVAMFGTKSTFE